MVLATNFNPTLVLQRHAREFILYKTKALEKSEAFVLVLGNIQISNQFVEEYHSIIAQAS